MLDVNFHSDIVASGAITARDSGPHRAPVPTISRPSFCKIRPSPILEGFSDPLPIPDGTRLQPAFNPFDKIEQRHAVPSRATPSILRRFPSGR